MAQQTFSGVPGDFSAGQVLTAADMDKLREFLLYLIKDGDETDTGEVSPLILDLNADRVGINTDSPAVALEVAGTAAHIRVTDSDTSGTTGIDFYDSAGNADVELEVGNSTQYFAVKTAGTERMRITSAGYVGINDPAPGYALTCTSAGNITPVFFWNSDSTVNANNYIIQLEYSADADCTGGYYLGFRDSVAQIGSISCASTSTVAFNTTSDYRIKSNVEDLTDAVASVEALRPITFTFTRDTQQRVHQGFLAHEAAEVYPLAVTGEKDGMRTVPAVEAVEATYDADGNELAPAIEAVPEHEVEDHQQMDASKLVPLLTAAVQELSARVAALEAAA
jgi:hypothetical protein